MIYCFVKRSFDVIASLAAMLITAPLWIVIAVGIKLSSKGPVFYRADRVGKNQKKFVLYKFRSMHVYQPAVVAAGEQREGGYIANANRIFKFGSFLRKSKLDELPQLINIFLGQMSVIGPRPITEAGVQKHYVGKYDNVLTVRPGLACLDSLFDYAHGELFISDNEEFDKKIAPMRDCLASMYVEKQSVALDLYCIFRTVQLIFEIVIMKKKNFSYTKYEEEASRRAFKVHN